MNCLRKVSALRTLKGNQPGCARKSLRFSVIKHWAPTYSVYPATKASPCLSPNASYLATISKGTSQSSSKVMPSRFKKFHNSRNRWGMEFSLISFNIERQIRISKRSGLAAIFSRSSTEEGARRLPRAKRYSLVSRTRNNLLLPELFPGLFEFAKNFLLAESPKGITKALFLKFPEKLQSFLRVGFSFDFHKRFIGSIAGFLTPGPRVVLDCTGDGRQ